MRQFFINLHWRFTEWRNSFRPLSRGFNDPHRHYGGKDHSRRGKKE